MMVVVLLCSAAIASASASNVFINGTNFSVGDLKKGSQIFFNRTSMFFGDIPTSYAGWKYAETNANATYMPGPLPVIKLRADADGYFYGLVADAEKPDVCAKWATDNGWEKISGEISFGTAATSKLHFYRKACVKDEWVDIVQPVTFSGVIIIAPTLTVDDGTEKITAAPVHITAVGWMETTTLNNGTVAFANRTYTYNSVKTGMAGLYTTRYNGGMVPKLKIDVLEDGDMYIAEANEDTTYNAAANGWTKVPGYEFKYNDRYSTTYTLYKKTVKKGDYMEIKSTGWQGILVFSSQKIDYTNITPALLPPPGVVIHNSKSNTLNFVGSPSIVVLKDGSYLASHDYFGNFITREYVYKSTDKGKTWNRIAQIDTLNWGKLFRRGDELYMMGVAPKANMGYGNIVIMRSDDGGYTWTKPVDGKHGLLRDGFYHCAPTPILFHNGRIWKGMENQGKADGWGPFGAFVMSIDEKADLLDAANWTSSNELQYTAGAVPAVTWLEGNAVISKDGSVVDVLRLHYDKDNEAGVVHISADGKTATFNPQTDISHVPGACKKFAIHYDSISNRYWTLSNYVLPSDMGGNVERTRNTLALCWSKDLVNWTVKDTLLHTDVIATRGFQYVDWEFEGDDIIAVSRTAWPDETGEANSQHNANYLTFHRFKNFRFEKNTVTHEAMVGRWYNNAQSAIALTFDDGFKAHRTYVYPILQQYNIPSTFFVITKELTHRGVPANQRYGTWEDFKEMAAGGQEIASHSVDHPNLSSMDYDDVLKELADSKDTIEQYIGMPCLTHAYPYCAHNDNVDAAASLNYIGARTCGGVANKASLTGMGWFGVNSELLTWTYPRSLENEENSFLNFKKAFESYVQPGGNFGVLCIHETLPFNKLSESSTYEIATTEWLQQVCAYLSAKRDSAKVWPTTFSNIIRYAQERDNLHIDKETNAAGDAITYRFSTWLDSSIFNVPLTVTLTPPTTWTAAYCSIVDGEKGGSVERLFDLTKEKLTIDIVPDRDYVQLVDASSTTSIHHMSYRNVNCYPVPATDNVTVQFGEPVKGNYELFNMQGQIIMARTKVSTSADNAMTFSVSHLAHGLYFLKVMCDNSTYVARIIKE
jgi:peptidoglycan/xylan/chitin deacetylase (PgdA/CDA1 family)